jgi:hypothetical protein
MVAIGGRFVCFWEPWPEIMADMEMLRRLLHYEVSVGALIEAALWLAIPYLCIGFVWAALHAEQTQRLQARLETITPAGADVAAFGLTAALWPASIQIAEACPQ